MFVYISRAAAFVLSGSVSFTQDVVKGMFFFHWTTADRFYRISVFGSGLFSYTVNQLIYIGDKK